MPKRRHPTDRSSVDPDDILSGRVKPTAAELLALIHRVNPTGRELPAREAELRYAQKSRLQSLLIRRFGQELTVVPDPEQEGTVSINHRGYGRDACHAVLDALDEDARAWVRLQLDLGPPSSAEAPLFAPPADRPSGKGPPAPSTERPPPSADATPDSLIRRADEAIDSFDYDRARARLERAVAASGGAPEPAAALLSLLVETLGDDAGAIALQGSLSHAALARSDVRGLLALAEARAGDVEQAVAWIRGASDAKAAEALAALAARARSGGDAERAAGHLAELRRRDAAHPSIVSLSDEIGRVRAAARGPAEEELARIVAAGREGEAEKKAAEVLARWPESEAARRVIRAVEERRRRAEADRLAAARAIEAAERAARDAAAVDRVARLLDAADLHEGLAAYLALDETLHARVREIAKGRGADAVRWLDLTGRGAPQARIEAVLAMNRALQKLAAGDAEPALATIGPHHAVLERVPEAKQLAKEAKAQVAVQRAARAGEALAAAKVALTASAPAEALRLLDDATIRDLPEPEKAGAAAIRAQAAARAARAERIARLGELRSGKKLFDARRVAEELAADAADEDERARWEAERRAIQAAIQRELCVEVDDEPTPIDFRSSLNGLVTSSDAQRWLTNDGRSLVMAEAHGRSVEIRVFDLLDRTVRTRVILRAPEAAGQVFVAVTGDVVWVLASRGSLLGLSLSTWEVKVHRSAAEVLPPGTWLAHLAFPVGEGEQAARFLWVDPVKGREDWPVRVIDLALRRPARELPEVEGLVALAGAREPRVACVRDYVLALHEERGTALPGGIIDPPDATPVAAALHPDGRSLVILALIRLRPEEPVDVGWIVVPEGGTPGTVHLIDAADGGAAATLAASAEARVVAIHFTNRSGQNELLVLGPSTDGLVQLYRVPVARTVHLVQDARGRRVFAIECPVGRLAVAEIGTTPPDLPSWSFPQRGGIDHVIDVATCQAYTPEGQKQIRDLAEKLREHSRANLATLIRKYQQRAGPTSDEGISLVAALEAAGPSLRDEARRVLAWVWERYPDEPDARLHRATRLARAGRWTEVERLFDPAIDKKGPRAAHFYHLLALAALHAGDAERARALVDEAIALFPEAKCAHLQPLAELLSPPPDPPEPATDTPSLAQLAEDARTADRCLARGDAAGALTALSAEQYWKFGDVQLFARMAEAHLMLTPANRRERFRKIMVLARFLEAHEEQDPEQRREMPLPGGTWDRARLDAVAERARAWLDGLGG